MPGSAHVASFVSRARRSGPHRLCKRTWGHRSGSPPLLRCVFASRAHGPLPGRTRKRPETTTFVRARGTPAPRPGWILSCNAPPLRRSLVPRLLATSTASICHRLGCIGPVTWVGPVLCLRPVRTVPCRGERGTGPIPTASATALGARCVPGSALVDMVPRACGKGGVVEGRQDRCVQRLTEVAGPVPTSLWQSGYGTPGSTKVAESVAKGDGGPLHARIHPSRGTSAPSLAEVSVSGST